MKYFLTIALIITLNSGFAQHFRGTWYGTNKLFLNALFFGPILTVPSASPGEQN
jgi:hypothetical protein